METIDAVLMDFLSFKERDKSERKKVLSCDILNSISLTNILKSF